MRQQLQQRQYLEQHEQEPWSLPRLVQSGTLGAIEYLQPRSHTIVVSVAHLLDDVSVDVREHAVGTLIALGRASADNASAVH